jgi:uncharacterized DUF497 family protein
MDLRAATGFDWDEGNRAKCEKHGVSLSEIEQAFQAGLLVMPDRTGSAETRFNAVGRNAEGRHLFVVFTLRQSANGVLIRPISARYMHAKEVQAYERTKDA